MSGGSEVIGTLTASIEGTQSADANIRRSAEKFLEQNEGAEGFPKVLLQIIADTHVAPHIRLGGAIFFKNWTKRRWQDANPQDRDYIKQNILPVLLSSPEVIRKQLSTVLATAMETETRETWPNLLPELGQKLRDCLNTSPMPLATAEAILGTLDTIFEPYRHKFRTDELFLEIKHALRSVAEPLTEVFGAVSGGILSNAFDQATARDIFEVTRLCGSVFYTLNWQDLPEYFEDHMAKWMDPFVELLKYHNAGLEGAADDTEASPLDQVQAQVVENVNLYQSKYEEEFGPYLERTVVAVFNLLQRGGAARYDSVTTNGMKFLTTVARSAEYKLFFDANVLRKVCESIVLPNMELREDDVELFEDNPNEYMRSDVEGSDADTRRRCSVELVRSLNAHFERQVTEILSEYVNVLLGEFARDAVGKWKAKDTAIYVVTALGWKTGTQAVGATTTSGLVSVSDFFVSNIYPEIVKAAENPAVIQTPVLVADAFKYTITFRNQVASDYYSRLLDACAEIMKSPVVVVHSYAALTVERLLGMFERVAGPNGTFVRVSKLPSQVVVTALPKLLPSLFQLISPQAPENEYAMKCVVRTIIRAEDSFAPHAETAIRQLCAVIDKASRNPSNPVFNHYLFEAVAAVMTTAPKQIQLYESALIPLLQGILTNEVVEFAPYALQLLAKVMWLYSSQKMQLPEFYRALAKSLLAPHLWDRSGFVPGMVKFLQGYVHLDADYVLAHDELKPMLGVFQKLVASRANDHHGIALLRSIIETYDLDKIRPLIVDILKVLMMRLQTAKTNKYCELVILVLSVFTVRYGPDALAEGLDQLEKHLLSILLTQVWAKACLTTPAKGYNRRLLSVALTTIITTERFTTEPYASVWAESLSADIALLEGIELDKNDEDEELLENDAAAQTGFNVAYSQLSNAKEAFEMDLVKDVEPHAYLATRLAAFTAAHPGMFTPVIQTKLEDKAKEALQKYLTATGQKLQ